MAREGSVTILDTEVLLLAGKLATMHATDRADPCSFALTTKLRPRQNVCRAPATGGVSAAASTARPTEVDSKRHPTSARRNLRSSGGAISWIRLYEPMSMSMCLSLPGCSLASRRQAGSWKGRRCSKPPAANFQRHQDRIIRVLPLEYLHRVIELLPRFQA